MLIPKQLVEGIRPAAGSVFYRTFSVIRPELKKIAEIRPFLVPDRIANTFTAVVMAAGGIESAVKTYFYILSAGRTYGCSINRRFYLFSAVTALSHR